MKLRKTVEDVWKMPRGDRQLVSHRKKVNICPTGRRYTDQLSTVKDPETDVTFNGLLIIKAQGD